jgi:hypothetical protein
MRTGLVGECSNIAAKLKRMNERGKKLTKVAWRSLPQYAGLFIVAIRGQ